MKVVNELHIKVFKKYEKGSLIFITRHSLKQHVELQDRKTNLRLEFEDQEASFQTKTETI